jgi:hypothetical protein
VAMLGGRLCSIQLQHLRLRFEAGRSHLLTMSPKSLQDQVAEMAVFHNVRYTDDGAVSSTTRAYEPGKVARPPSSSTTYRSRRCFGKASQRLTLAL